MCCKRHKLPTSLIILIAAAVIFTVIPSALGIRFNLWKEECFSQKIEEDEDIVRVSCVVIRRKSKLHASTTGIDLVVTGPYGEQVHDDRDKKTEHFEFIAHEKGLYKFCFTNKAKYSETVDFNIAINHQEHLELAKNEHLATVKTQINELRMHVEALMFHIQWLLSDQYRLEEVNEVINFWTITKTAVESVALVGSSIFQVYLLKRLFKRRLGE